MMRYDERPAIDALYSVIARLSESAADPAMAMVIADGLLELGEDRSWASVWWAYGAVHHDLSDEACARALELLGRVDRSDPARAAALMLTAEIESTSAIQTGKTPDARRQIALLSQALELAPDWPALHARLASALVADGRRDEAPPHIEAALAAITEDSVGADPLDTQITGVAFDRDAVAQRLLDLPA
jgi:tetratricopeptide (TPR) repeat protein